MKFVSPLKVVFASLLLLAGVLVSVALWSDGGPETGLPVQPTSTGDKSAIFTATPAPTPSPTPIPSGTVVEVTYFCSLYLFALGWYVPQDPMDELSGPSCRPPYPPGLIYRDESGEPMFELQGLHLRVMVRQESGDLFEEFRTGPLAVAVGDTWPPE